MTSQDMYFFMWKLVPEIPKSRKIKHWCSNSSPMYSHFFAIPILPAS